MSEMHSRLLLLLLLLLAIFRGKGKLEESLILLLRTSVGREHCKRILFLEVQDGLFPEVVVFSGRLRRLGVVAWQELTGPSINQSWADA